MKRRAVFTDWPRWLGRQIGKTLPPRLAALLLAGHYQGLLARLDEAGEPDLTLCRALLNPGDVVCDVGASIGVYALACARCVGGDGLVLAVEPMPFSHAVLRGQVARSGLRNLILVRGAAGTVDGPLWMSTPLDQRGWPNHYLARVVPDRVPEAVRVAGISLDGLLRELPIALLKLDVEGHEPACLQGALATIGSCRPALLVEINSSAAQPYDRARAALCGILDGLGYQDFVLTRRGLRPGPIREPLVNHWFLQPRHLQLLRERCPALLEPG